MTDRIGARLADVIRAAVACDEAEREGSKYKMTSRHKALIVAIKDYNDAVRWEQDDLARHSVADGPENLDAL